MAESEKKWPLFKLNSVFVVLFSLGCAAYSLSLPMGTLQAPGAGAWPFVVSAVMSVAALILLFTERDSGDYEPLSRRTWVIVVGFALMAGFIVAFTLIGLTIPCFVLSLVWLRWMAGESWKLSLLLAVFLTAAFVMVFSVLLAVPMPQDPGLNLLTGKAIW